MNEPWIEKNLVAISVEDITKPISGRVATVNHWWLEKDGQVYKTKRGNAYQCNRDRRVVDKVYEKLIKESGFSTIHIPVAYVEAR
jgi:hypothetical protein